MRILKNISVALADKKFCVSRGDLIHLFFKQKESTKKIIFTVFLGNFKKLQRFKSAGHVLQTSWNFMKCPPENECLNNHHTCDPVTQKCIDTLEGFECKCNQGKYIKQV